MYFLDKKRQGDHFFKTNIFTVVLKNKESLHNKKSVLRQICCYTLRDEKYYSQ